VIAALSFVVLGLRASYFVACVLAFFAYGGPALYAAGQAMKRRTPSPGDVLPIAFWIGAIGGIAFIGKRVLLAVLLGQQIVFDRGPADSAGTAIGLALLTAANFLPAWAKALNAGNDNYGKFGGALIVGAGILFAAFYAAAHRVAG
jgi:hypothetical protein